MRAYAMWVIPLFIAKFNLLCETQQIGFGSTYSMASALFGEYHYPIVTVINYMVMCIELNFKVVVVYTYHSSSGCLWVS